MFEKIKEHGGFFTVATVILIITGGYLVIERPDNWLSIFGTVAGIILVGVLATSAKSALKASGVALLAIFGSALGIQFGASFTLTGELGLLWGMLFLSLFFADIATSYFTPSIYSRWGCIGLGLVFGWVFMLAGASMSLQWWGVVLGWVLGYLLFIAIWVILPRRHYRNVPEHKLPPEWDSLKKKLSSSNWGWIDFVENKDQGYLLTWRKAEPTSAFLIYPIDLEQPLGVAGKGKRQRSTYMGKNVNPWMLLTYYKVFKNATIGEGPLLVFWDYRRSSGLPRTISLKTPDSQSPTQVILASKISPKVLKDLEDKAGLLHYKQVARFEELDEA